MADTTDSKKIVANFDFEGDMTPTSIRGYEYKGVFSPSESISDMPSRMEQRIKKVRKLCKNYIFVKPYKPVSTVK